MGKKISKKEKKKLRFIRADLITLSEEYLSENTYELLPELFTQIAEISTELEEPDLADEFKTYALQIHSLIVPKGAELEPKVLETYQRRTSAFGPLGNLSPQTLLIPNTASLANKLREFRDFAKSLITSTPIKAAESPSAPVLPPSATALPPVAKPPIAAESPASKITPFPKPSQPKSMNQQNWIEKNVPHGSKNISIIAAEKEEKQTLYDILNQKLPLMPDNEKNEAIDKLLSYSAGIPRDTWLKIFIITNKRYAK